MFFFKKKPLIFTSFISEDNRGIFEYAPMLPSQKIIPAWWKQVSPGIFDWDIMKVKTNVKSCIGIINTLREGLILPLWSEIAIKTDLTSWKFQYADTISTASVHNNIQAPGFYEDYFTFKLHSPWYIKCSENNIKLHFSQPFYHFTSPTCYFTPPGIVSPVKNGYSTNIFLYVKKTENQFILEHNTPLLQIIPLSDRSIQYKTEILSSSEFFKLNSIINYGNVFLSKGVKRKLF